jgi:hypothetical protein
MAPARPRTGGTKARETGVDLSLAGAVVGFLVALWRSYGPALDPNLETAATVLLMALSGSVLRWWRHGKMYGKRRG